MEPLNLKIAELAVSVFSPQHSFLQRLRERYSPFLGIGPAPIMVELAVVHEGWDFSQAEKRQVVVAEGGAEWRVDGPGFLLLKPRGEASYQMVIPEDLMLFSRALRVLYAHLLLQSDGMLVHASALKKGERGYLFLGRSGAGKTTVATLGNSLGRSVLSDELCALRAERDGYRVYGTPFTGTFRGTMHPSGVPLCASMKLVKGTRPALLPLSRLEGAMAVLQCVMHFSTEPQTNHRIMDQVNHLVAQHPPCALEFERDPAFLSVLEQCP